MQIDQVVSYLDNAIQLERDVYIQSSVIKEFDKSVAENAPSLNLISIPEEPIIEEAGYKRLKDTKLFKGIWNSCLFEVIFVLACLALIITIPGWMGAYVKDTYDYERGREYNEQIESGEKSYPAYWSSDYDYLSYYLKARGDRDTYGYVALGCAIFIALTLLIPFLASVSNNSAAKARYRSMLQKWEQQCKRINDSNKKSRSVYERDSAAYEQSNKNTRSFMTQKLYETQGILDKLYKKDVIYTKYHNLPALTSICEYLRIGRCSELTGPHGAYNLYEDELRKDTIISRLDVIIDDLQQIKNNQFMLYQQLTIIKSAVSSMAFDMKVIKSYAFDISYFSRMSAYYSELSARNTAVMAYLN
ncbi:MAG: hypothetical protein IKR85_05305 [Clostridia bacterium]|nr:hypothetical protein [Clostridia bacterium]